MSWLSTVILIGMALLVVVMLHPATGRYLDRLDGLTEELGQMDDE